MLFAAKPKGFFIEISETSLLLARTTATDGPIVIEELRECAANDAAAWTEIVQQYLPKKAAGGYLQAVCGVYPSQRVIRRATIEPKRVKEAGYLNEVAATQFRIEPDKYSLALLNASDGHEYDMAQPTVKEVTMCGLPAAEIVTLQDRLLAHKIYPERLELGSVAILGALTDYLRMAQAKAPLLVLEIGLDVTHSFIVSTEGLDAARPIPQGLSGMVPVVQKELGLKDEESARKLFFSNTFDFTGLAPAMLKRLLRELQSSIGFHEVQTGQSIGQILCIQLPPKLEWLEAPIAAQLGISPLRLDLARWIQSRGITIADTATVSPLPSRWLGLLSLMAKYDVAVPA